MNPLTQVKNTQKITAQEAAAGISEQGSWHEKYKDSAYVNIGLLPFDLTEGDLLAIFAQYGEVVDVNLVRDKATGKSRGFAFLAYEDQRSTVLAVDNLNGARVVGRTIRVDHVANYKKKVEENEEEEQRKREERGVCYAFQRGECNRGAACKFSHDEQRNANDGWGKKDDGPTWGRQRNGRSPPPPPWKQNNGLKDNPPPWRRSSGQKDDPPPARKVSNTDYGEGQKGGQFLPRRDDDRSRDDGLPIGSSSRKRHSQMDVRGRGDSDIARPSRRYDGIEDDHPVSRRGSDHRDVSPHARRHNKRRDNQSIPYNDRDGELPTRRSGKRRDDGSPRRRYDSRSEDSHSPKRRSRKREDDGSPRQRQDNLSEDDSSPKRRPAKRLNDGDDASLLAHGGHVKDERDDDSGAAWKGDRRDSSPSDGPDKHQRDDDYSPKGRSEHSNDNNRNPRIEQRSSGTRRR